MSCKIYNTPILTSLITGVFRIILFISGWKIVGERPPGLKKFVVIGAPHSSNWDLLVVLMTSFKLKLDIQWLAKDKLFRFPYRRFMGWLGGISVNRDVSNDVVKEIAKQFAQSDSLVIGLSPEGTRRQTSEWKSGFWYIAKTAQVPLILAFVDARNKQGGILGQFELSDDIDADIRALKKIYAPLRGIKE